MQIIAGSVKGKKLITPKGSGTRPALAQVREAIFSSLGDVEGLVILDVFAGCGSLSLEGLSRGADFAYFIDSDSKAVQTIITNLENLGFSDKGHIFKRRLPQGLKRLNLEKNPDIIFCDPPYDKALLNPTLQGLVDHKLIDAKTTIIVEHTRREMPDIEDLELMKQKKYGQTLISFLQLK
jgi:16S rRNA (guanine966-N2)-methyltransferase